MVTYKNPYISRVKIKHFRNFLDVDVELNHKQVVVGENNVGKSNFLRAIQLILDKDFSDNDRQLSASDFHDSIAAPMENGEEIEIILQVRGYEHNSKLVAQFDDAVVSTTPPTLEFKYHYFPNKDQEGNILFYKYEIYKGNLEKSRFTSEDRRYINIYVIKALRDVERELKANKNSPLYKLVKKYDIQKDELSEIAELMKEAADEILELDEIDHIKKAIQQRFSSISGLQTGSEITLRTFDIDMERLLYSIQVYMGLTPRPVSELSLGLANILYVSLMLILLKDRTILPILKPEKYAHLETNDQDELLKKTYALTEKGNYLIREQLPEDLLKKLYVFMDETNTGNQQSFTILAVEEPEAHLHPILQRLIYREVLHKSETSVVFTSHSTFITAIAPLSTIVHIRRKGGASKIFSTANLYFNDGEANDIERYLDAKRGEIYFGKGVILTEGITEEYIVPAAAELQGSILDDLGIIICNVHSTNFEPYLRILDALQIPTVVLTDGDYYEVIEVTDEKTKKRKKEKIFHILSTGAEPNYRGNEVAKTVLVNLGTVQTDDIPEDFKTQDTFFRTKGFFIGHYTLEVDMMQKSTAKGETVIKTVYSELNGGGKVMQENFEKLMDDGDHWTALVRIEQNVSKGRFAQRLSQKLIKEMVPSYIEAGISYIINKVRAEYE